MNSESRETPRRFIDQIQTDHQYTIEEATGILADYHHTSTEAIQRAFTGLGLEEFQGGTVEFLETVNGGYPCLRMVIRDKDGGASKDWHHLLDIYTGQPQNHVG